MSALCDAPVAYPTTRRRTTIFPVAVVFHFEHDLAFDPANATELLRRIPEADGVLALFGPASATGEQAQPFLTRTANLRRRAQRLLEPPPPREQALAPDGAPLPSRRLNLRDRVARISWSATGSEFESLLTLYHATAALFSLPDARRRLKLHTPFFVRFTAEHAHPRVYVTNRLSRRGLSQSFGPFASRAAAERYTDAALDLFKLRRCHEDLVVSPTHPGCAYGEMRKCLAPCNTSCTADEYAAEAAVVEQFFRTRGESLLASIAREREQASEEMDFERAAALHKQYEKVKAAAALADELVRPIPELRAVIVQAAARDADRPEDAALFLLERSCLAGPERLSTLGVRAVKEQTSVGSSLFAQPLMLQAVPLPPEPGRPVPGPTIAAPASLESSEEGSATPPSASAALSPEERAATVLAFLEGRKYRTDLDPALLSDHLALLRRWYYRPEKQRSGELFLPNPDGSWPLRRILRGAARAVLGHPKPMQASDREAAKTLKTRLIHAGREGVERSVPVLERSVPVLERSVPVLERSVPVLERASLASASEDKSPAASAAFRTRRSREQLTPSQTRAATDKLATP